MGILLLFLLGLGEIEGGIRGIDILLNELNTDNSYSLRISPTLPLKTQVGFMLTGFLIGSSIVLTGSEKAREKLALAWEVITSPNHVGSHNRGKFHIKTWRMELKQRNQLDKGVHFMTGYILPNIVAVPCAYVIHTLRRDNSELIPEEAYQLARVLVLAGGIFEEIIDGYEKDEGFSYTDLFMNFLGVMTSYFKRRGKLEFIDFYWSFSMPPPSWKYFFWDYMDGYSFNIRINLKPHPSSFFKWWSRNVGYLPDRNFFNKLFLSQLP
jgi:hypothetical protein